MSTKLRLIHTNVTNSLIHLNPIDIGGGAWCHQTFLTPVVLKRLGGGGWNLWLVILLYGASKKVIFGFLSNPVLQQQRVCPVGACFKFWGVAGSEDFACATLPTTSFDFQGKVKSVCHPTLLKIRFKISVTPPPLEKGQSQNYGASIN